MIAAAVAAFGAVSAQAGMIDFANDANVNGERSIENEGFSFAGGVNGLHCATSP